MVVSRGLRRGGVWFCATKLLVLITTLVTRLLLFIYEETGIIVVPSTHARRLEYHSHIYIIFSKSSFRPQTVLKFHVSHKAKRLMLTTPTGLTKYYTFGHQGGCRLLINHFRFGSGMLPNVWPDFRTISLRLKKSNFFRHQNILTTRLQLNPRNIHRNTQLPWPTLSQL